MIAFSKCQKVVRHVASTPISPRHLLPNTAHKHPSSLVPNCRHRSSLARSGKPSLTLSGPLSVHLNTAEQMMCCPIRPEHSRARGGILFGRRPARGQSGEDTPLLLMRTGSETKFWDSESATVNAHDGRECQSSIAGESEVE